MKFTELNINDKLKESLTDIGFEEMMPIQEESIPTILEGVNVIGEADTGTGKTASFAIPLLNNIDFKKKEAQGLIVTPTRELAMQIVAEMKKLGKKIRPSIVTLVGGMSIRDQVKELKSKPAIIVGTLGRINDHLRSKKLDLSTVKYFVLDEADEMLKEGFKDDITAINNELPKEKQTLLFSATISKPILALSKLIMDDYKFISVKDKDKTSVNIDQYYIFMKEKEKFYNLTKLLDMEKPSSAIIFGRTKRRVDELNEALNKCGYRSVGIHGDLSQGQRNAVMKKFREHQINILVATDVAARGLDISDITHVYNFDLPQEVEFYVHRIGRTGRAKKHGISYSFIKDSEISHIRKIEEEAHVVITEKRLPTYDELSKVRNAHINDQIDQKLSEIDITKNAEFTYQLLNDYTPEQLISVLIETLSKKSDITSISLTGEPGVVVRKKSSSKGGYNKKRAGGSFQKNSRDRDKKSKSYGDKKYGKKDNFKKSSERRKYK